MLNCSRTITRDKTKARLFALIWVCKLLHQCHIQSSYHPIIIMTIVKVQRLGLRSQFVLHSVLPRVMWNITLRLYLLTGQYKSSHGSCSWPLNKCLENFHGHNRALNFDVAPVTLANRVGHSKTPRLQAPGQWFQTDLDSRAHPDNLRS